jgi:hypothetical protein
VAFNVNKAASFFQSFWLYVLTHSFDEAWISFISCAGNSTDLDCKATPNDNMTISISDFISNQPYAK